MDESPRDYAKVANDYARTAARAKTGRRFCKWVRLAAKRHIEDLKRAKGSAWPYEFDEWHADDVCDFIEKLPHIEGRWDTPTITLEPWQIFILVCVFGWRRRSDGHRRFNTVYIEVARKNAKSTISSGVALYCLTCEGEPGPQVKIAATTGDQARIVFDVARKMVDRTPDLREAFNVEAMANAIPCWDNEGSIKPINAKASTQDGLNPHCTIVDELHAHKDRALFDVLKSARGARKNPLSWYITTAGYFVDGVCFEQRTLVVKILEGVIEADHYFGIIFTLDEGDDEFDPRVWGKPNPNLEVSVQLAELKGYAEEARVSPDSHGEFLTKRMNVWTSAKAAWVNINLWKRCDGPVDIEALHDEPCWGGLDLAAVVDMAAFRLAWRVDGRLKTWGRFYLPEETVMPRTERGNVPYQVWARAGLLTLTPGDVIDYAWIERDVMRALDEFDVQAIAYDPWNATDLVNRLVENGAPMVEFRQGPRSFHPTMQELERCYIAGNLDHGGDPILTWNASNVIARKDVNENMAPDRKNSIEKIDGMVALLMAIGVLLNDERNGPSVYEDRGVVAI